MARLVGTVYIGGGTPDKYDEPAEVIRTLNNEGFNWRLSGWNGKWLYTESGELVSHKAISKHDLNKSLYGKVSLDSNLYDILGFKKGKLLFIFLLSYSLSLSAENGSIFSLNVLFLSSSFSSNVFHFAFIQIFPFLLYNIDDILD